MNAPQPHPIIAPWIGFLRTNERLTINCFAEVSEEHAHHTPSCPGDGADLNSMIFIALHMVDARAFLLKILSGDGTHRFSALTKGLRKQSDLAASDLPSVGDLLTTWREVSAALREALAQVSADDLAKEADFPAPLPDPSLLGVITFLSQHDSYHLGQLAYARRLLGYDAMSYS